jgi:DNA-binding winged helix-turn-helix (wHTH) protein
VFAFLAYLVRHRHHVVSNDELLRELWPDAIVTDTSLQRAVSLARCALRRADRGLLRTHAGHGTGSSARSGDDPDAVNQRSITSSASTRRPSISNRRGVSTPRYPA